MVRFLGVASLLLFSHIALVAADAVPAVRAKANDIFMRLLGRDKCPGSDYSESYSTQLNQLSYSFYAQRRAKIMGAARQAPTVVTTGMVNVRACFNDKSLIVSLTMGLIQAVRTGKPAGRSTVTPGAFQAEPKWKRGKEGEGELLYLYLRPPLDRKNPARLSRPHSGERRCEK